MKKIAKDQFPVVFENGKPQAVIVDVRTFDHMVKTLENLKQLADDPSEIRWIVSLVKKSKAYRATHPDEVSTYNTPDEVLKALSGSNPK